MYSSARTQKELEQRGLYKHLYSAIEPGPSMPGVPIPGKTAAVRAKAANYQDMYQNIQAMRESAFKREKARGEFTSLGGYLGQAAKTAAKTTAPGLLVAAALVGAYFLFFNKKKEEAPAPISSVNEAEAEAAEAAEAETAEVVAADAEGSRYYYY